MFAASVVALATKSAGPVTNSVLAIAVTFFRSKLSTVLANSFGQKASGTCWTRITLSTLAFAGC